MDWSTVQILASFLVFVSADRSITPPSSANRTTANKWQYRSSDGVPSTLKPRLSCYECYGSLESCATDRRNLIGGPKIKRCARDEDQCLFRKDPYSNFVALTCSADCVSTAITFCCTSSFCNCIGPSGCPAAIPKPIAPVTTPQSLMVAVTEKTPPTTSRLFPHFKEAGEGALFRGNFSSIDNEIMAVTGTTTTTPPMPFHFRHVPGSLMKIAAKSLSLEHAPDLVPSRLKQSEVFNQAMDAPIEHVNASALSTLHCWQCSGTIDDCTMQAHQTEKSLAQVKACASEETFCSIVEFGDIQRSVEMECSSKCSPLSMKHLKISCCTTSLCNCLIAGKESSEDCRVLTASDAFMEGSEAHPTMPMNDTGLMAMTTTNWYEKFMPKTSTTTTSTTTTTTTTTTKNATKSTSSPMTQKTTTAAANATTTMTTNRLSSSTISASHPLVMASRTTPSGETSTTSTTEMTTERAPLANYVLETTTGNSDIANGAGFDDTPVEPDTGLSCYNCYHCPTVIPPTEPETQAVQCPEGKQVACVKAEANFVTLVRIDRYCSDICPTDTDMVKYYCCRSDLCNRSSRLLGQSLFRMAFASAVCIVHLFECSFFR